MDTAENETSSRQTGPILQLKRKLLPIDEYAAREGISRSLVEQCAKLGIVQIRKFKGETFVVDVPPSPHYTLETAVEPAQPADKAAQPPSCSPFPEQQPADPENTPKSSQIAHPEPPKTTDRPAQLTTATNRTKSIPKPVQITPSEILEIIDEPPAAIEEIALTETLPEPVWPPDPQEFEIDDEFLRLIDESDQAETIPDLASIIPPDVSETANDPARLSNVAIWAETASQLIKRIFHKASRITNKLAGRFANNTAEAEKDPEQDRIIQDDGIELSLSTPHTGSRRAWKITAFLSPALLIVMLFVCLWLYIDRKIQLNKADAGIQRAYIDFAQVSKKAQTLQSDLDNSNAQIGRLRNELDDSATRVKIVQNGLIQARQNLEAIRRRNAEAVEQFNEQIQKLVSAPTAQTN